MVAKVQETSIEDFSKAFIAYQRLPRSCKLVVFALKDKRAKRSDALVKMYPLRMPRVARMVDESTVTDLLEAARSALSTDVKTRGWELRLHNAGVRVPGNKQMTKLWREDDNRQEELRNDEEVELLLAKAEEQVFAADAAADNPEVTVPRAYLKALVDLYSPRMVRQALASL